MKKWQAGPAATGLRTRLEAKDTAAREAKNQAEKEAEEAAKAGDEDRKAALAELEAKRKAKQEAAEQKERDRKERARKLEEEKAKKDPWLLDPAVKEAEAKLEDLKEQRRDANAKLEFDVTKQLTADINAQERHLKKVIKKAKKAHKKGKTVGSDDSKAKDGDADKAGGGVADQLKAAEKRLDDLKKRKAKAADDENFKLAKQLKQEQADLEKEVNALRAKSEL